MLRRYNLDAEGYDVEMVGRGDDADTRPRNEFPILPRWTACCGALRHRTVPLSAGAAGNQAAPDHHAHRAR